MKKRRNHKRRIEAQNLSTHRRLTQYCKNSSTKMEDGYKYIEDLGNILIKSLGLLIAEDQKNGVPFDKSSSARQEYFDKIFAIPQQESKVLRTNGD